MDLFQTDGFQDATTILGHNIFSMDSGVRAIGSGEIFSYEPISLQAGVLATVFGDNDTAKHLMCIMQSQQRLKRLACAGSQYFYDNTHTILRFPSEEGNFQVENADVLCDPTCGEVVKQLLYKPPRQSSYTANVTRAILHPPIWFRHVNGHLGIPLRLVSDINKTPKLEECLDEANQVVTFGGSASKFVVIHILGKQPFQRQIRFSATDKKPQPSTRATLVHQIASVMHKLFENNSDGRHCRIAAQSQVVLLGCIHASKGHIQPIFSVYGNEDWSVNLYLDSLGMPWEYTYMG